MKVPILTRIQCELKAPKDQYSKYGDYHYRSAEQIEAALKPLLLKYGAQLTFHEHVLHIGERYYIQEIACYKDSEQETQAEGHARESLSRKGMDDPQLSGTAESYATKYALEHLFLIDDTPDSDQLDNRQQGQKPQRQQSKQSKKAQLINYPVVFNNQSTTMGILLKHYKAGNKTAINFANGLTGDNKFIFENLKQMEGVK